MRRANDKDQGWRVERDFRSSHTFRAAFSFALDFALGFATACFLGVGSELLLSDSDDEDESDESEESETEHFQSMIARKTDFPQHIPSVLALRFLTLLGLSALPCLFIAGILLFCGW